MIKIHNILILVAVTCCTGLFCSCGDDTELPTDGTGVHINGDNATLTFQVGESISEEATRAHFKCDTVIQKLNDSLVLETVIIPDYADIMTRSNKAQLIKSPTTILTVSKSNGKYYKRELSTVTTDGKFSIHLPVGMTFDLVFYAVNGQSSTIADFNGYFTGDWVAGGLGDGSMLAGSNGALQTKTNETARDLIYYQHTGLTVNSTTKLPKIDMKHLFCKAKVYVSAGEDTTAEWQATVDPSCKNASVSLQEPGVPWITTGERMSSKVNQTKDSVIFIPAYNEEISLSFDKLFVDGVNFDYLSHTFRDKHFERGHSYIIKVQVKKPDFNIIFKTYTHSGYAKFNISKYNRTAKKWELVPENQNQEPCTYVGELGDSIKAEIVCNGSTDRVIHSWYDYTEAGDKYDEYYIIGGKDYQIGFTPFQRGYISADNRTFYACITNSTSDYTYSYIVRSYEHAPGNLKANYTFESSQEKDGAVWQIYRSTPSTTYDNSWVGDLNSIDPCTKVLEYGGGWKAPRSNKIQPGLRYLYEINWVKGTYNGVTGMYYGATEAPKDVAGVREKYLFLPLVDTVKPFPYSYREYFAWQDPPYILPDGELLAWSLDFSSWYEGGVTLANPGPTSSQGVYRCIREK